MKLTLMKVGAKWCGPCISLAKRGTLERFAKEHDDVRLEIHDDAEAGSARWESFADKWRVKSLPTLIWLVGGEEVLRSSETSLSAIEQQYTRAKRKAGIE